jgi:hypothetical protein
MSLNGGIAELALSAVWPILLFLLRDTRWVRFMEAAGLVIAIAVLVVSRHHQYMVLEGTGYRPYMTLRVVFVSAFLISGILMRRLFELRSPSQIRRIIGVAISIALGFFILLEGSGIA